MRGVHIAGWSTTALLVPISIALAACGSSAAKGHVASASLADQARELGALEKPALSSVKRAAIDLSAGRRTGAADALERIGRGGRSIRDWLDGHRAFVSRNRPTAQCLEETMTDLGKEAQQVAPALRAGRATKKEIATLRRDLGEAANCIEFSD